MRILASFTLPVYKDTKSRHVVAISFNFGLSINGNNTCSWVSWTCSLSIYIGRCGVLPPSQIMKHQHVLAMETHYGERMKRVQHMGIVSQGWLCICLCQICVCFDKAGNLKEAESFESERYARKKSSRIVNVIKVVLLCCHPCCCCIWAAFRPNWDRQLHSPSNPNLINYFTSSLSSVALQLMHELCEFCLGGSVWEGGTSKNKYVIQGVITRHDEENYILRFGYNC